MRSSAAALKTFAAKRILLLTPFDASLNRLIRDFLGQFDLVATSPGETLPHYTDALKMTPDDVIAYARRAIAEQRQVDAIYFQGAVLDPMDCLEQMERELKLPVVASNPAMNWYMLSKLGLETSAARIRQAVIYVAGTAVGQTGLTEMKTSDYTRSARVQF